MSIERNRAVGELGIADDIANDVLGEDCATGANEGDFWARHELGVSFERTRGPQSHDMTQAQAWLVSNRVEPSAIDPCRAIRKIVPRSGSNWKRRFLHQEFRFRERHLGNTEWLGWGNHGYTLTGFGHPAHEPLLEPIAKLAMRNRPDQVA